MKIEPTEEDLDKCRLAIACPGGNFRAAIHQAFALCSARIPEPQGWIARAEREPTEEDGSRLKYRSSHERVIMWLVPDSGVWLTVWNLGPNNATHWCPIPPWTPEPTPAPVRIPLDASDVPPGSVVRWRRPEEQGWFNIDYCATNGLHLPSAGESAFWTWERLMAKVDISRDGGKTWHPCHKEATE